MIYENHSDSNIHGVLEGIQFVEVDITWIHGIKPDNVVSYFCIFHHVVVSLVCWLSVPPLTLIVLLNGCSLVSNHPTLCLSNDAESTPAIDVSHHIPCPFQDVVSHIIGEVRCPDMCSESLR